MKTFTYIKILYYSLFTDRKYWRVKYPKGGLSFLTTYHHADKMADLSGGEVILDFNYLIHIKAY